MNRLALVASLLCCSGLAHADDPAAGSSMDSMMKDHSMMMAKMADLVSMHGKMLESMSKADATGGVPLKEQQQGLAKLSKEHLAVGTSMKKLSMDMDKMSGMKVPMKSHPANPQMAEMRQTMMNDEKDLIAAMQRDVDRMSAMSSAEPAADSPSSMQADRAQ